MLQRVRSVAYHLDLPSTTKLHPTFHVLCLKKKIGAQIQPRSTLPPVNSHREILPEIEAMVDRHLKRQGHGTLTEVLVKWNG